LTYWRSVHLLSGLSPIVPLLAMMAALAVSIWFALHGLALFGPDRPQLPSQNSLRLAAPAPPDALCMFSREDAGDKAEELAECFTVKLFVTRVALILLVPLTAFLFSSGIPIRSLGHQKYACIFLFWLTFCGSRLLAESGRLYLLWEELRRLLMYLDKLTLRRTMAALRGFSWGSVWKMSGNVLEVRYKLISRQLECMNHLIVDLTPPYKPFPLNPCAPPAPSSPNGFRKTTKTPMPATCESSKSFKPKSPKLLAPFCPNFWCASGKPKIAP
jgi:hypothetical protein